MLLIPRFFKIAKGGSSAIIIIILFIDNSAMSGGYEVNKNNVSNLFNKEIEDRQGLEQFLEDSKIEAQKGVEGKAAINVLGQKEKDLEQKAAELNAVNANDLEARGREERAREENAYFDKLEIDYLNPQILTHKNDIDKIADATNKLTSKLFDGLRDIGIDCKQIKGDKELEPNYSLDIKKEDFKETIYDRKVCEVLRNQYNCRDTLFLRCAKKGTAFGSWQNRTMVMTFGAIPRHWWIEKPYYGLALIYYRKMKINSAYVKEMATYIAGMIGARSEQVYVGDQNIVLIAAPNCGSVNVDFSNCRLERAGYYADISPTLITFHYQYRDGYPICEQWAEDWSETCVIQ
jgi:hypothetical protein